MKRTLAALGLVVLLAAVVIAHGMWQAKTYNGTTLGLYSAAGDSSRFYRAQIDTAETDTLYGRRAHILRAWIDTLNGDTIHYDRASFDTLYGTGLVDLSHVHIDTLSVDSLTVALAYFDTLTADTLHAIHLAASVVDGDIIYTDYLGGVDQHVFRAYIDSLAGVVHADTAAADTLHAGRASIHRLDGWRAGVDTLRSQIDSTAALFVCGAGDDRGYARVENWTLDTDTDFYGLISGFERTAGADAPSSEFVGGIMSASMAQEGGTIGYLTGFQMGAYLNAGAVGVPGEGDYFVVRGFEGATAISGGSVYGPVWGMNAETIVDGPDTIAGDVIALRIKTSNYAPQVIGGESYVLWTDDYQADWNIYQAGTAPNHLENLGLGDSLTVTNNVHAAAYYGDGSNLTGIAGGDTSGLRSEWRVDISDSLAGFTGGVTDHGDLDSLSLLDDDHPQYLTRVDFPDSFATAWPAAFVAAMADSVRPAIHDTANALRGEWPSAIADSIQAHTAGGSWIDTTAKFGSFWNYWWTAGGSTMIEVGRSQSTEAVTAVYRDPGTGLVLAACGANGLKVYEIADLNLTHVDSLARATQDILGDAGYVWLLDDPASANNQVRLCTISQAGAIACVDSAVARSGYRSYNLVGGPEYAHTYTDASRDYYLKRVGADLQVLNYSSVAQWTGAWAGENELYTVTSNQVNSYTINPFTGAPTYVTATAADSARDVCGNSKFVVVAFKRKGAYSYRRNGSGGMAKTDSLSVGNFATAITCDEQHVYIGTGGDRLGFVAATIDTSGQMAATDTIDVPQSSPMIPEGHTMFWDGEYLIVGTNGYGTIVYQPTDNGVPNYSVEALFTDTTMIQGPLTIDLSAQPTVGTHDFTVKHGAAYSYVDAGDADWTASSSRALKELDRPFSPALGARVLEALSNLPIQNWYWRGGDGKQHVGPTAEDWYKVALLVAPKTADPTAISGEHKTAALLLAVQELARRDSVQDSEIADLRRQVQWLTTAEDK